MAALYNTMFDVAFTVEHHGDPENVPADVLIEALQRRINTLRALSDPNDVVEAFGVCDSYEIEKKTKETTNG